MRAPLVMLGIALMFAQHADAQILAPSIERNVAYFELGGPGGLYSLNYERLNGSELYLRVGATTWDFTNLDNGRENVTAIIAGATRRFDVSELLGRGEGRFLELGGLLVAGNYTRTRSATTEVSGSYVSAVPELGIRYEPPSGGFTYRITFTPLVPLVNRPAAFPQSSLAVWGGFSAGYVFR